ncbi:MAG: hypothetical protein U9N53_10315 [Bacteroidota bacterium]|nr:hypothetical protein [Bacteroidota bacterium]
MKPFFSYFLLLGIIFATACVDQDKNDKTPGGKLLRNSKSIKKATISFQNENRKSIFYGLYSPNEISKMLEGGKIQYKPETFLPIENASQYTSSSKTAMNLGIYGANFSISKMFDDPEEAIRYMGAISELSEKLGIPANVLESSAIRIEQNIGNIDSISNIATEIFATSTEFLLETGRESALSLILMGGWIEGMYQALNMFETDSIPDPQMIEMVIEQKYALNFLLTFLKNQYEDPDVAYYYRLLEVLADHFGSLEIYYHPGDVEVDTIKQVIITNWNRFDYSISAINNIKQIVTDIRSIVVET